MLQKIKYNIIRLFIGNDEALVVYCNNRNGGGFIQLDEDLPRVLSCLLGHSDEIKECIFKAIEENIEHNKENRDELFSRLFEKYGDGYANR